MTRRDAPHPAASPRRVTCRDRLRAAAAHRSPCGPADRCRGRRAGLRRSGGGQRWRQPNRGEIAPVRGAPLQSEEENGDWRSAEATTKEKLLVAGGADPVEGPALQPRTSPDRAGKTDAAELAVRAGSSPPGDRVFRGAGSFESSVRGRSTSSELPAGCALDCRLGTRITQQLSGTKV